MTAALAILAIAAYAAAAVVAVTAMSAIHEIIAGLAVLVGTVAFAAAVICYRLGVIVDRLKEAAEWRSPPAKSFDEKLTDLPKSAPNPAIRAPAGH